MLIPQNRSRKVEFWVILRHRGAPRGARRGQRLTPYLTKMMTTRFGKVCIASRKQSQSCVRLFNVFGRGSLGVNNLFTHPVWTRVPVTNWGPCPPSGRLQCAVVWTVEGSGCFFLGGVRSSWRRNPIPAHFGWKENPTPVNMASRGG